MTDTLTPEQKQTLLAAIPKIEQAGGPKWYSWCVLGMDSIEGTNAFNEDELLMTHSPPAVAAAVVAWAVGVAAWFNRTQPKETYPSARVGWTRHSKYCVTNGRIIDDGEGWVWTLIAGEVPSRVDNELAASVALISAVAEGLGEG